MMSVVAPAVVGTMMRTGRVGQVCATAAHSERQAERRDARDPADDGAEQHEPCCIRLHSSVIARA